MIPRHITPHLEDSLRRQAAVALLGPRQIGKTTLAQQIGQQHNALYLDMESANDRYKLENPQLFFESQEDRLVILDEIHRVPALFETLRGVIDQGRQKNKGKGRFLVLGSASIELLRQSSETLAGRIAYIQLGPLSPIEVGSNRQTHEKLWLRGGFPDSFLAENDQDSLWLRKDFIRTYLERDIAMFGPRVPAATMERLWTMLAHRQGTLLNASELGRNLEMSTQSVTRYIDLLCDLLLVRRLLPYHANVNKRLVKSSKVYIRDSGLVHALLGVPSLDQLAGHPVVGLSWEGFIIESLLALLPWRSTAYFYRTTTGNEIDLLIEHGDQSLWAIEIKRSLSPKARAGFHLACADVKPSKAFVVHAGHDRYPIAEGLEAIGLIDMMHELQALSA